jgi:Uma2 family endonuclease
VAAGIVEDAKEVVTMAAPAGHGFNPLTEFDGRWTTALAELYLPVEGIPPAKYECVDGKLILSPRESFRNGFVPIKLARLAYDSAEAAGLCLTGAINLLFTPRHWIEPDFAVVHSTDHDVWVDATDVELVGEVISPTSRTRDHIDKPALCAAFGIPYYLTVEVNRADDLVRVDLWRLRTGDYHLLASAQGDERFKTDEPFPMSFAPVDLLPR